MKDGGCNHVRCAKCRADFCWACMRPRTSCRAYECKNGAPFGNRSPGSGRERLDAAEEDRQGMTLIERIDDVEAAALRNLRPFRMFPLRYAAFIGAICCITSSSTIQRILSLAATFFFSNLYIAFPAVLYSLGAYFFRRLRWTPPREGIQIGVPRRGPHQNGVRGSDRRAQLLFRWPRLRTDEDQLAEAMARSLVEQWCQIIFDGADLFVVPS